MNSEIILEFNIIKQTLCDNALTKEAKAILSQLKPYLNETVCNCKMRETTQARTLLDTYGTPPLPNMNKIGSLLVLCEKGVMLLPEQLSYVSSFIASCIRLTSYLKKSEQSNLDLSYYGRSMIDLTALRQEIDLVISGDQVSDHASTELRNIRKAIEQGNVKIREKLDYLLRSKRDWFTDSYISARNGHYVLPVKKEYKHQLKGSTIDISATGSTCFIEPLVIAQLQEELVLLQIKEENEIHKLLYVLTALVEDSMEQIKINMDAIITLDVIFAKAKLSSDMNAREVPIVSGRNLRIVSGRHPLLSKESCIPLNFSIGNTIQGIVITGPNTGGKTVTLKTVGLLSIMAQCGLHVPVADGSLFRMNNCILCDIGDGQSISQNLSTFSSHITNIISILDHTFDESLVLLDELGSGTDPAEGMGIAIAILEALRMKNCLFVATTHYPEVKEYATITDGLVNARMTFDRENLRPNYQLEIGEAGESCALYIAKRLGFPAHLLEIATTAAYGNPSSSNSGSSLDKKYLSVKEALDTISTKRSFPYSNSANDKAIPTPHIVPSQTQKQTNHAQQVLSERAHFKIGDSVMVYPQQELGLIYQTVNVKGELGVQIKGSKKLVSYKRLKLHVSADELYPEDYDFSIIFDTVENRKARHKMNKGYQPNLQITYDQENK